MKNLLIIYILLLIVSVKAFGQETVQVTGIVTDKNKEPLIGVNVFISNVAGLGTVTDVNGRYTIKMPAYNTLVFSYIGFNRAEVLIKEQREVNIVMEESDDSILGEVVVTGTGVLKKIAVTGAITTVDVEQLKTNPSMSILDNLAGVVPGVMAMKTSGKPGSTSEFWIRSISTFGASNSALVLVDGFERDLNEINVEDIESFTVLKDASATAIYGARGANGVILVNTKRGKEGKINIKAKVERSYNTLTKVPEFADGYTYASLANEAKITRNEDLIYQPEKLEILRLGLDPNLFPNVDWMDVLLRDGSWNSRATLNMNGGGKTARYFVSGSYQNQEGMYKVDKSLKDYNTNANFRKWTYRINVDIDITKTTILKTGVSGSLRIQNDPGIGSDAIWTSLMGYNPIMTPLQYSNGYIPAYGDDNGDRFNPWVQATMTGYLENWDNNIQTNVSLEQKLDLVTKGLSFVGRFGYDTENSSWIKRYKHPEMYRAEKSRDVNGNLIFTRIKEEQVMTQTSGSGGKRNEFLEIELHYDRRFGDNRVGAVLKYTQSSKVQTVNIGTDIKNGIARRNQSLAGRVNYNWLNRFFIDFNFGYTGSENFHKDNRFGFFPAISGAWNIGEEPFLRDVKWLEMFKIRYSYGKTGNDNLGDIRFPYLYEIGTTDGNAYNFGNYDYDRTYKGKYYSSLASPNVSWEIAIKQDLGLDFSLFKDQLSGAIDYFSENREGIYMVRNYLPWSVGVESNPSANVGIVKVHGFDGNFILKQKIGNVDFTLRGNMTYSKNEIIERDEENSIYGYTLQKGHRVDQSYGLISLGLFRDYEEIRNSPAQTFGEVMPGDIKYKDVNGDGIIDKYDRVAIGTTRRPNLTYGFGASAKWKGLDVSIHFQGVGKSTFQIKGSSVFMFQTGDGWGNILNDIANSNRWILGENEDPNAEYPRLTYGDNPNNYQESTFWLRNGSYIRLKTLDMGYTLPGALVNKLHLNQVRVFFVGTNLLTFSKFKLWDPELASSTGKNYPLSKTLSLGISVNL
ncbi:MAG: TonB-dependent receptor [Labilibaculum sp.]|nr:TonB-dependent receptor [Labilibaculum sp.]